ncbi:SRPBCC family protein [Pedobacter chinensis]|nr:SRPBCC domain-containing protein [Pedobacter chinensis]
MKKVEVIENIKASTDIIISAFTDTKMLKDWWGVERTLIEKKVGGLYTLAWNISDKAIGFISTGIISNYNPKSTLVIDNFVYLNPDKSFLGPMTLTIKTKEKGNISEIYLCQEGYQHGADWDWYYEAVKQAWPTVLQTLKRYLENAEE